MDLGIRGKTALVCAASKGLGRGCAFALAREGVNLVVTARGREALEKTAQEIRSATGVRVTTVVGDITTDEGRRAALALSNGARTGLTGFIAGLARQTAKHNVTINNLLPGSFLTDRARQTIAGFAKAAGLTEEQAAAERLRTIPAGRLGDPAEFGEACAYLCSAQASYVTGQNFLIDGGAYPGTF